MKIVNKSFLESSISKLEKIPTEEIRILYSNDHWDGPLEGMCKWKEKNYYFYWPGIMNEKGDEIDRKFVLIDLTDEQLKEEEKIHKLFLEKIGDHYVYVNGKMKEHGASGDELSAEEFYQENEKSPAFEVGQDQLVGWFEGEFIDKKTRMKKHFGF